MPNRNQLSGFLERYLQALATGDPSPLPLAPGARFTENTQTLALGEGLWKAAPARRPGGQVFIDDQSGQAVFFGVVEAETPTILGLRLKVETGLISEIETAVVAGGGLYDPDGAATPREAWTEVIRDAERRPREAMFHIADLYFEGLVRDDGDIIPLTEDAFRIENGVRTANNPDPDPDMPPNLREMAREGVAEQLNKKRHSYIGEIRERRYLAADEARGVAFGIFMFDHPGQSQGDFVVPQSSALIMEAFKIKGGLIRQVEAVGLITPWKADAGWPGGVPSLN